MAVRLRRAAAEIRISGRWPPQIAEVLEAKKKAYAEYKQVREEMRELQNVKVNIDYLLGPSAKKTQDKEHR